jgi:hypothetical protein
VLLIVKSKAIGVESGVGVIRICPFDPYGNDGDSMVSQGVKLHKLALHLQSEYCVGPVAKV